MFNLHDSQLITNAEKMDSVNDGRRRSSRFINKRKQFDNELAESSLGLPGVSTVKSEFPVPSKPPPPSIDVDPKRKALPKDAPVSRRNKKGRRPNKAAKKDLGRWKPTDDLALIIGVQQTNDLKMVHLGTKFSCKFTLPELERRWYALLYDQPISQIAVEAMRNLHPHMIATVRERALWSVQEEQIISTIKYQAMPSINTFVDLLAQHLDVFYPSRTAAALQRHWRTMRLYHLLPDQLINPLPSSSIPILSFSDAEDALQDVELNEPPDETLEQELRIQQHRNTREIRQLENELGRWNVLVDSITGLCPGEFDNQTLAVLRGRLVRYLMRSREITIGRSAKNYSIDVDLSLEGPAEKISRRQGTIRLRNTGEFYLFSQGKRPIFVNGRPIMPGNKARLFDNSVVEFASLRFIFSINQDLIRVIHNESVQFNLLY